ncbi:MAG: hypothetical protein FWH55_14695 [Oscillospiraceae bacterium]|nr:hypothetical protein [Oscillospiraceae bacterium]
MSIKSIYSDMLPVLKDEIQRIHDDDITGLDNALKLQQAMILKTKNSDERINAFLSDMDISANTLTETIEQLPEEARFRFYAFLGEFSNVMEEVAFYRDKCRELLQTKLYKIEYQIEHSGITQAMSYDEHAGELNSSPYTKVFEKMI